MLVVGAANSGQQIALELVQAGRDVDISVGQKLPTLPQRWLGRDLWWWLTTMRVAKVRSHRGSASGCRNATSSSVAACASCVTTASASGRASPASGRSINFEGGESAEYDGVVWATGFGSITRGSTSPRSRTSAARSARPRRDRFRRAFTCSG